MTNSNQQLEALRAQYKRRYDAILNPLAEALRAFLTDCLKGEPRIDRIGVRPKDVDRFVAKATKLIDGKPKYAEPLEQIQDQIGARIITFYPTDVERLNPVVKKWFNPIEFKDHVPESEWEFGYFGRHYVLAIPTDVIDDRWDKGMIPRVFELQVKTLFEHAWSEAEHDLGYKPGEQPLTPDQTRRLAYTSAQAWGADRMFDELFRARSSPADQPAA
jgi:ppGpp synthetase/RelA/SpoT-type nucleotidyltranferase